MLELCVSLSIKIIDNDGTLFRIKAPQIANSINLGIKKLWIFKYIWNLTNLSELPTPIFS